ncbi:MAG: PhnD/SsuA/transferrin family substrate-binding protein [Microcoleaceae cyanobacterium]
MFSRRFLLFLIFSLLGSLILNSCQQDRKYPTGKLIIGVVSYENGLRSLEKYEGLKNYLAAQTNMYVELEPVLNELKAIEQVKRRVWSIVFAPPGLAAIAIQKSQYNPIFPMQGFSNLRSLIVVKSNSKIQKIQDLSNKTLGLGQPGSAAGYYMPLYDLYGLTLTEIKFYRTPKQILQWLSQDEIDAGALSESEFEKYKNTFSQTDFRIIHKTRLIPPSLVLLSPQVNRNLEQQIIDAMKVAPPNIIGDTNYIPTGKIPDYRQFIKFVEKVRPLETKVQQKPAVLVIESQTNSNQN